jgi:hypothetical protein
MMAAGPRALQAGDAGYVGPHQLNWALARIAATSSKNILVQCQEQKCGKQQRMSIHAYCIDDVSCGCQVTR